MVAYNVHLSLAQAVIYGRKCSILKPHGKRPHAAEGDVMHIDTGNLPPDFSKSAGYCRLMVVPCCLSIPVRIEVDRVLRDGVVDTQSHRMELMAQAEGHQTFAALRAHLAQSDGLPWDGQLLRWNPQHAKFRAQWPLVYRAASGEGGERGAE